MTEKMQHHQKLAESQRKLKQLQDSRSEVIQKISEANKASDYDSEAERLLTGESSGALGPNPAQVERLRHQLNVIDHAIELQRKVVSDDLAKIKQLRRLQRLPRHREHIKTIDAALSTIQKTISENKELWRGAISGPSLGLPITSTQIRQWRKSMNI